jgi:DNA-binding transcriptional LysR family regulator
MAGSLDEIAAFVAVVAQGSFRAAADHLGASPSAVSKRVSAQEQRLEVQLLHRTTRRLSLTRSGELLYERVADLPGRAREAEDRVRDEAGRVEGQLRVIMPSWFESATLYEQLVPSYLREHPGVDLILRMVPNPVDHTREPYDLLVAGKLPHHQFPDSSTIGRRLLRLRGALFASPAYLEQHGGPAHPDELAHHNCLGYLNPEWHFIAPDGDLLVHRARGNLRTNSNEALLAATRAGLGIAYSFPAFFERDLAAGRVVGVLEPYTRDSYVDVHVFYPDDRFIPRRTRAFMDALVAVFA